MATQNSSSYNSPAPIPGLTLINIVHVEKKGGITCIYYDIGIGPSAGYAHIKYQQTGTWPLLWTITDSPKAEAVYLCALTAAQYVDPHLQTLEDACNISIAAILERDNSGNIRVCRSYPRNRYRVSPAEIELGTGSWAKGSPDFVRATLIAKNSGLPVLLADAHEKDSPMVAWCAEHGIAIQPMLFPCGDYRLPRHDVVVDRKANLLELYENFAMPSKRPPYDDAAALAASHGQTLIYVIATKPEDHVNSLTDLQQWSAPIPGKTAIADGKTLYPHLTRYKKFFPHTDFIFCPESKICEKIYDILRN